MKYGGNERKSLLLGTQTLQNYLKEYKQAAEKKYVYVQGPKKLQKAKYAS